MREKEFLKTTHLIGYPILKRLLNDIVEKDFTYCVYFDTRNLLPIHKPYQQAPILKKARQDRYLIAKTLMHLASYWAKFFDEMGVEFVFIFFSTTTKTTPIILIFILNTNTKGLKEKSAMQRVWAKNTQCFKSFIGKIFVPFPNHSCPLKMCFISLWKI